jgi:hypothetical protein
MQLGMIGLGRNTRARFERPSAKDWIASDSNSTPSQMQSAALTPT